MVGGLNLCSWNTIENKKAWHDGKVEKHSEKGFKTLKINCFASYTVILPKLRKTSLTQNNTCGLLCDVTAITLMLSIITSVVGSEISFSSSHSLPFSCFHSLQCNVLGTSIGRGMHILSHNPIRIKNCHFFIDIYTS